MFKHFSYKFSTKNCSEILTRIVHTTIHSIVVQVTYPFRRNKYNSKQVDVLPSKNQALCVS